MPVLNKDKLAKLISYCIGKEIPKEYPIRKAIELKGKAKGMIPLGSFFLRGVDMDGFVALVLPKKASKDGLVHYLFVWFSKQNFSTSNEEAHVSLQVKSLNPPQFSLRGKPDSFVRVLGESSMIQSILVDLIDDIKCLEGYTIYNKKGSQRDAYIENYSIMTGVKMFGPMEEFTNFCSGCGKRLPQGDNAFCMHCGAKVE
ncbi:MAG: zinc ribbon domain-containing protein [Candidatus Heimdallarchaeota archaeon]